VSCLAEEWSAFGPTTRTLNGNIQMLGREGTRAVVLLVEPDIDVNSG
jgi:hypothetical protein